MDPGPPLRSARDDGVVPVKIWRSYLPCQFGVRLPRKASMPSRKSALV
jgi:hypothetical protein